MTQLNSRYLSVLAVVGNAVTIGDLTGANINSTAYGAYTSGGTAARIYTINSPYTSADDLRLIKYAQSVNQMVLCHPNHPAYILTIVTATNWTLNPISIGASISPPTGVTVTKAFGFASPFVPVEYGFVVTSID